jgi:hypothetical protein
MTTADISTYVTDEAKIIKRLIELMNGCHKTEDMLSLPFRNFKRLSVNWKNTNIKFL